jgi:hypothetical protein
MIFSKCLRCGGDTTRYSNVDPMAADEAESLLRHAQFNAFYERYCAQKKIPVKGELPEWYLLELGPLNERLLQPSTPPLK